MGAAVFAKIFRMAAPAAILIFLPGVAMAEVCDKGTFLSDTFPAFEDWIRQDPARAQLRQLLNPSTWVTAALLIWLIVSNGTRATIAAMAWFVSLVIFHAVGYLSIDLADPYYQAAISEGCVENSPRRILSNLGFAVIAGLLTYQRMRRQKSG